MHRALKCSSIKDNSKIPLPYSLHYKIRFKSFIALLIDAVEIPNPACITMPPAFKLYVKKCQITSSILHMRPGSVGDHVWKLSRSIDLPSNQLSYHFEQVQRSTPHRILKLELSPFTLPGA